MKKFLALAAVCSVMFAFTSCDDSAGPCPSSVATFGLMNDINGMKASVPAVEEISSVTEEVKQQIIAGCTAYAQELRTVVEKNKALDAATLTADWDAFKSSSTMCQTSLTIKAAVSGLNFAVKYPQIKTNSKTCSAAVTAGVVAGSEEFKSDMATMEGWHNVLQSAADYTGKEAAKEK